jgi:hypothetical protein
MIISDLEYLDMDTTHQKIDLKKYNTIFASGGIDLISYDENTGLYNYRFSIKPNITFIDNTPLQETINLNADVYFSINNKHELIVQGQLLHHSNNKPMFNKYR